MWHSSARAYSLPLGCGTSCASIPHSLWASAQHNTSPRSRRRALRLGLSLVWCRAHRAQAACVPMSISDACALARCNHPSAAGVLNRTRERERERERERRAPRSPPPLCSTWTTTQRSTWCEERAQARRETRVMNETPTTPTLTLHEDDDDTTAPHQRSLGHNTMARRHLTGDGQRWGEAGAPHGPAGDWAQPAPSSATASTPQQAPWPIVDTSVSSCSGRLARGALPPCGVQAGCIAAGGELPQAASRIDRWGAPPSERSRYVDCSERSRYVDCSEARVVDGCSAW